MNKNSLDDCVWSTIYYIIFSLSWYDSWTSISRRIGYIRQSRANFFAWFIISSGFISLNAFWNWRLIVSTLLGEFISCDTSTILHARDSCFTEAVTYMEKYLLPGHNYFLRHSINWWLRFGISLNSISYFYDTADRDGINIFAQSILQRITNIFYNEHQSIDCF